MNNKISNFTMDTLTGLKVLGSSDIQIATFISLGHYNREIRCAAFNALRKSFPKCEEDINADDIVAGARRLELSFKYRIQDLLKECEELDKAEAKKLQEKRMQEQHKHSERGTVADICSKYNLSKGEVRRMKAEGTLDSYIATTDTLTTHPL